MGTRAADAFEESGILIAPGDGRRRDATRARKGGGRLRRARPWLIGALVLALLAGGGFTAHRYVLADTGAADSQLAAAKAEAASLRRAADDASARAVALEKELADAKVALADHTVQNQKLLAEKQGLEAKAAAAAALEKQLASVVGDGGTVTRDGEEIRLELVDKVLFRLGDDQLTPHGEAVLYKVGEALGAMADKQIWVQGHTDDTPITPAKGVVPRFATNWELSAARALTVVHYLQDEAKIDPKRLAAVAFSQYRPASRAKAKNRRIEIVLYPRHLVVAH